MSSYMFTVGDVYGTPYGGTTFAYMGLLEKADLAFTPDEKKIMDTSNPSGGVAKSIVRISDAKFELILHEFTGSNLAMGTLGSATSNSIVTNTSESHTAVNGSLTPLTGTGYTSVSAIAVPDAGAWQASHAYSVGTVIVPSLGNTTHSYICSVAGTSGSTPPTWVTNGGATAADGTNTIWIDLNGAHTWAASHAYSLGDVVQATVDGYQYNYVCTTAGTSGATHPTWPTSSTVADGSTAVWTCYGSLQLLPGVDYQVKSSGLYFLPDGKIGTTAKTISVTYTTSTSVTVQGMLQAGTEFSFVFSGTNIAESDLPVDARVFKVLLHPVKNLGMISDNMQKLEITGTMIRDNTVTGSGESQYFTYTQAVNTAT